jgi:hypothetical protein
MGRVFTVFPIRWLILSFRVTLSPHSSLSLNFSEALSVPEYQQSVDIHDTTACISYQCHCSSSITHNEHWMFAFPIVKLAFLRGIRDKTPTLPQGWYKAVGCSSLSLPPNYSPGITTYRRILPAHDLAKPHGSVPHTVAEAKYAVFKLL